MKILALDSTAKIASCAVLEDKRLLSLFNIDNGLTQSELLLPMIEASLENLGLKISDIRMLAVTVGPGSFTGVRIGTATVKGLAFGRDIPCAPVSTLEALAYNLIGCEGIVVSAMDARRAQVYTAIFHARNGEIERLSDDAALPIDTLADMLKKYDGERIYIVGDGYSIAHSRLSELGIKLECTPPLLTGQSAYSVGLVGLKMHSNGECVTDMQITPTYLRLPQAERERLSKIETEIKK